MARIAKCTKADARWTPCARRWTARATWWSWTPTVGVHDHHVARAVHRRAHGVQRASAFVHLAMRAIANGEAVGEVAAFVRERVGAAAYRLQLVVLHTLV